MSISADALHHHAVLFDPSNYKTAISKCLTEPGYMLIRFTPSISRSCCKLMVQCVFRNMSVGITNTGSQVQHEILAIARLLNDAIAVIKSAFVTNTKHR